MEKTRICCVQLLCAFTAYHPSLCKKEVPPVKSELDPAYLMEKILALVVPKTFDAAHAMSIHIVSLILFHSS